MDSLGRKRANAIPHPRVKTMIAKSNQKLIADVAKELGIAKSEVTLDDVKAHLAESKTKYADYDQRFERMMSINTIAEKEPARFLSMLAASPVYAPFAEGLKTLLSGGKLPAAKSAAVVAAEDDPEPEPDIPLTNEKGEVVGHTYSIERLKEARAWDRRQAKRESLAEFGQRLEPFEKERHEREQREAEAKRKDEVNRQAEAYLNELLDRMSKRKYWGANEGTLLKAVQDNPKLDVREAYIDHLESVVIPGLTTDANKVREQVLADINKQPRSTSLTPSAAGIKTDKPKTTADHAREALAELGL